MLPRNSRAVFLLLLAVVCLPKHSETRLCSCGMASSEGVYYEAPSADLATPDPRVVAISREGDREAIEVAIDVEHGRKALRETLIRTLNDGRTWVRESTREKRFQEFSQSPVLYRVPLPGVGLERSSDNGKHWRQSLLQVNSQVSAKSQRQSVSTDSSDLRLEVAAIHPENPDILYGCFSEIPRPGSPSSASRESRDLHGVYVSNDGGDHWSLFFEERRRSSIEEPCLLRINPSNSEIMVTHGQSGLVITRDGGKNWTLAGDQSDLEKPAHLKGYREQLARLKAKGLASAQEWPFDWTYLIVTDVLFDSSQDSVIYLVTNKGLYKTKDGAHTWCLMDTAIETLFGVRSLYIDKSTRGRLFVGTANQVLVSDDGGCHFRTFLESDKLTFEH